MFIADILEEEINQALLYEYAKKHTLYSYMVKELAEAINKGQAVKYVQDLYSALRDADERNEEDAVEDMVCPSCGIPLSRDYKCIECGRSWR